jgi:hypothetical protein
MCRCCSSEVVVSLAAAFVCRGKMQKTGLSPVFCILPLRNNVQRVALSQA